MKHNTLYITLAAVAILAACNKKDLSEREDLDSRPVAELEVQYEVDGQAVEAVSYTHEYARPVIQVKLNNEGLRWNLESNRAWCKVVPGEHRGSGPVTLELDANESFDARESATLTFTAGDFRGFKIQIDQSAAAFIISQPYFIGGKDGGDYMVNITTKEGVEWTFEPEADWLTAAVQGAPVTAAGQTVTSLKLTAAADEGASRMGSLKLSAGAEKDAIRFWQFGTDVTWENDAILLPSEAAEAFSLLIPHGLLKEVNLPKFATYSIAPVSDVMDKLTVGLEKNYSDLNKTRAVAVSVTLTNNDATVVALPAMIQDYVSAGGLVTPEGLLAFAERVANGGSTKDWENEDGWVTLFQDIDMTGVSGWAGIGTKDHPFSGLFDGKGHAITSLKSSPNGIFNYVQGKDEADVAVIQNLTVDASCIFYANRNEWTGGAALGAVVNHAANANIIGCYNYANLQFVGTSEDDSPAWVGGIVGNGVENVTVRTCVSGKIQITYSGVTGNAYVGGIAGDAQYVTGCTTQASLLNSGACDNLYLAGITGILKKDHVVSGNTFKGMIELKGTCSNNFIGGLYAAVLEGEHSFDLATDMSDSKGEILVTSFLLNNTVTRIYAGGFVGYAAGGTKISWKGYEPATKLTVDNTTTKAAALCCLGGVLGGCDPSDKVTSLSFDAITTQGAIDYELNGSSKTGIRRNCFGGIVGLVNGPASFNACTNTDKAMIGHFSPMENGSNNSVTAYLGGLVAYADGGDISFSNCVNQAKIGNVHYVNNVVPTPLFESGTAVSVESTGGIIGGFNFNKDGGDIMMTLTDCSNSGQFHDYRGFGGGLAGFCQNAKFSHCTNASEYYSMKIGYIQGGIAGLVINTVFENCSSTGSIAADSLGQADAFGANAGGIAGRVYGTAACTFNSCTFKGIIYATTTNNKTYRGGGIVGFATEKTVVTNCYLGGTVQGTPLSPENVKDFAVGNKAVEPTNTQFIATTE